LVGILLVFYPMAGVEALTLLLAVFLAVEGLVRIGMALRVRKSPCARAIRCAYLDQRPTHSWAMAAMPSTWWLSAPQLAVRTRAWPAQALGSQPPAGAPGATQHPTESCSSTGRCGALTVQDPRHESGPNLRRDALERAVALRYTSEERSAPVVVAQGRGAIARRLIEIASANGVPVREDPDLVALLSLVDLGEEIPPVLYQAVAEVIRFIYRANGELAAREHAG
jgi:flagellar biosynthesis protein